MAEQWYALRSKPRKEDVVWNQVRQRGFEVFYPRHACQSDQPTVAEVQAILSGLPIYSG